MAMPYSDDISGFFKRFATVMFSARKAVFREYCLLLRFPRGSDRFRRQFDYLGSLLDEMHKVFEQLVNDELQGRAGLTYAIFDDSSIKKTGLCFEGEAVHHDSVSNTFFHGFKLACAAVYRAGKFGIVEASVDYSSKMDACKQAFTRLCNSELSPDVFLFDAWYAAQELLTMIDQLGKIYITRLKSNIIVDCNDEEIPLRALARSIEHTEYERIRVNKKTYWTIDILLTLKNYGKQRVIISKNAVFADPVFLTTNSKNFSTKSIVAIYLKRFIIEVFFKDAKQFLHLETFQCRTLQRWKTHFLVITILHWCVQTKKSISKTILPIRHSIDKITSYINKNQQLQKITDELLLKCKT